MLLLPTVCPRRNNLSDNLKNNTYFRGVGKYLRHDNEGTHPRLDGSKCANSSSIDAPVFMA